MGIFTYSPDEDLKVHEEGAIKLICKPFQSHENGLPEWLKNSADAYARQDAGESHRVIIVILDHRRRKTMPSISCLDFCGMTSRMIEKDFRNWADPDAARRGSRSKAIQGGHGNGGKCYMTQMFSAYAQLVTVRGKKGNRYGVEAGSIRFGYIPNREYGRDFPVDGPVSELEEALAHVNCPPDTISKLAGPALEMAKGFTLITGVNPKGYEKSTPIQRLVASLQDHPQMIATLELCRVHVVVNGNALNDGKPLELPDIPPMPGAEEPRVIPIPEVLFDPETDGEVSSTHGGDLPEGVLTLRTSDKSMRWGKKGRHVVIFEAQSGYVGFVPVPELDVQSSYGDRIYGACFLPALEPFKQNDRAALAVSPLTRAVRDFISKQVEAYAREFEAKEKRRYDQEARDALSRINEALDRWKNHLLDEALKGLWGPGEGRAITTVTSLPAGKPARIEISLSHRMAGIGVAFRPSIRFLDKAARPIRAVPFRWVSEDNNVAMVDEDLMVVNTFARGQTLIRAETLDGRMCSNEVRLEVVHLREIDLSPKEIELPSGTRGRIDAVVTLSNGQKTSDVYLIWDEDDPQVARVSASGLVFGLDPGQTAITAGDDRCLAKEAAVVKVVPAEGRGPGKDKGRGYPRVLISGVDPDPETDEPVVLSPEHPAVYQRPRDADRNIWWINSAAPLARMYLGAYGYDSREWRIYHVERHAEVFAQIALACGPQVADPFSVDEFFQKWGAHVADFQASAAASLQDFIDNGAPPEA